jgi:rhodanese-related sulfurtransferase
MMRMPLTYLAHADKNPRLTHSTLQRSYDMKFRVLLSVALSSLLATSAWAYDADLAARIAATTSKMDQTALAKAGSKLKMDDFLARLAKKEKMTILDIRTPAEMHMVAIPGSVQIPLDQLMAKENLDRLPTDEPIVIVCHSGARANVATTLLKIVGFSNVAFLDGGAAALANAATPKSLPVE